MNKTQFLYMYGMFLSVDVVFIKTQAKGSMRLVQVDGLASSVVNVKLQGLDGLVATVEEVVRRHALAEDHVAVVGGDGHLLNTVVREGRGRVVAREVRAGDVDVVDGLKVEDVAGVRRGVVAHGCEELDALVAAPGKAPL